MFYENMLENIISGLFGIYNGWRFRIFEIFESWGIIYVIWDKIWIWKIWEIFGKFGNYGIIVKS